MMAKVGSNVFKMICLKMFFTVNTSSTTVNNSIQAPRQREIIAVSPINSFPLDNISNDLLI